MCNIADVGNSNSNSELAFDHVDFERQLIAADVSAVKEGLNYLRSQQQISV